MDWADSNLTFCHSRVRAACSAGIAPKCTDRSIGAPAAIRPCRKPGASKRGHLPRCRERVRWPPTRMSRRLTSMESSSSSSLLAGRASQGRGQQQQLQRLALQGEHAQTGAGQQATHFVGPCVFADGVEAPVQDALAGFQGGLAAVPRLSAASRVCWGRSSGWASARACSAGFAAPAGAGGPAVAPGSRGRSGNRRRPPAWVRQAPAPSPPAPPASPRPAALGRPPPGGTA